MNCSTVRLIQNCQATFRTLDAEKLFTLVLVLADELERRELPAALEARALQLALLPAAREQVERLAAHPESSEL